MLAQLNLEKDTFITGTIDVEDQSRQWIGFTLGNSKNANEWPHPTSH